MVGQTFRCCYLISRSEGLSQRSVLAMYGKLQRTYSECLHDQVTQDLTRIGLHLSESRLERTDVHDVMPTEEAQSGSW